VIGEPRCGRHCLRSFRGGTGHLQGSQPGTGALRTLTTAIRGKEKLEGTTLPKGGGSLRLKEQLFLQQVLTEKNISVDPFPYGSESGCNLKNRTMAKPKSNTEINPPLNELSPTALLVCLMAPSKVFLFLPSLLPCLSGDKNSLFADFDSKGFGFVCQAQTQSMMLLFVFLWHESIINWVAHRDVRSAGSGSSGYHYPIDGFVGGLRKSALLLVRLCTNMTPSITTANENSNSFFLVRSQARWKQHRSNPAKPHLRFHLGISAYLDTPL